MLKKSIFFVILGKKSVKKGAYDGDWTRDPTIKSRMLYRTELRRRVCVCVCGSKGGFIKVKVGWVEVKGIKKVVGNWPEVKKM